MFNKVENLCLFILQIYYIVSNYYFKVFYLGYSIELFLIYRILGQFWIYYNLFIQFLLSTDYVQCIRKDFFRYIKMNMKLFLFLRSLVFILRNEICIEDMVS